MEIVESIQCHEMYHIWQRLNNEKKTLLEELAELESKLT
jgi:hypothetical protein